MDEIFNQFLLGNIADARRLFDKFAKRHGERQAMSALYEEAPRFLMDRGMNHKMRTIANI
jgi:hypothetical protein